MSLVLPVASAKSAPLTWGINGAGGNGTWNTSTSNWFDGAQNGAWPAGGDAIFAGASGIVGIPSGTSIVASSLVVNTSGYHLGGSGKLLGGAGGLEITTNADAQISAALGISPAIGLFMKKGSAKLRVSGAFLFDRVTVNQGELEFNPSPSVSFTNFTLADDVTAILTLGAGSFGSYTTRSLNGGGVVRPRLGDNITLNASEGIFAGTFQDNGNGKLTIDTAGGGNLVLMGANTNSGPTIIDSGSIFLSGNGSLLNSIVKVSSLGSLVLDNTTMAKSNRISDSLPFTMENTRVHMIGNAATPVEEVLGSVALSGASSITATKLGSAVTLLRFSGFTRNGHATVSVIGDDVSFAGLASDSTGIAPPMFTAGNDWARIGSDGRITALTGYTDDINSGGPDDHVKLTASGSATLVAPATRSSLNLQNSDGIVDQELNLGGQTLGVTSGGIQSSGTGSATIRNGNVTTTAAEWNIVANNPLTIRSSIRETATGTALVKSGTGTLTLTGTNTYSGTTAIMEGTLIVSSDASLGTGSTIEFGGGTLLAGGSFSSTKNFSRSSPLPSRIDTGIFDVTFSGDSITSISKVGAGTLTLTHENVGVVSVSAGILILPNVTSGSITVQNAKLQAAGKLSSLSLHSSILEIGGQAAATLGVTSIGLISGNPIIDFGIGSSTKDLLTFASRTDANFEPSYSAVQFNFSDLGGVTTGVDYPLITYPQLGSITPSVTGLSLAPNSIAAGWAGTFSATTTAISVRFTAVPEPGTVLLFLEAATGVLLFKRLRARKRLRNLEKNDAQDEQRGRRVLSARF